MKSYSLIKAWLLLTTCLVLTGCPARWQFVFVNPTTEPLLVRYSGYKPLLVPPGESRQQPQMVYTPARFVFSKQKSEPPEGTPIMIVSTADGRRLYAANGDEMRNSVWYTAKYPDIFVRVTRTKVSAFPTLAEARR